MDERLILFSCGELSTRSLCACGVHKFIGDQADRVRNKLLMQVNSQVPFVQPGYRRRYFSGRRQYGTSALPPKDPGEPTTRDQRQLTSALARAPVSCSPCPFNIETQTSHAAGYRVPRQKRRDKKLPSPPPSRRMTGRSSAASSGLLPMPGSPSSSWALYRARLGGIFRNTDFAVLIAFWLFGLINNVLYVIILSAAQDLVGSDVPKGVVLLADVLPSFFVKMIAPYFIDKAPYALRIIVFVIGSSTGMLLIALTPPDKSVGVKMAGVVFASFTSGGGELSFLGLTHYYGHMSLAAWGSGTGAAGLVGAGLYVMMTNWLGFSVKTSLLASACLPVVMLISFFVILPRGPLHEGSKAREYLAIPEAELAQDDVEDAPTENATSSLLSPSAGKHDNALTKFGTNFKRAKSLFFPYMLPLLLVYVAEYTINQGVSPTLLFPLNSSPFSEYRSFYPFYGFLYQLGVFVSRSSIAFVRIHSLYIPSFLQVGNLVVLALHALFFFIPSVYIVFILIFWEGLLGGAVYVNTFAEIMETVPSSEREFSLSATSVSDSAGICMAGFISMAIEPLLCNWQVQHGRDWCKKISRLNT